MFAWQRLQLWSHSNNSKVNALFLLFSEMSESSKLSPLLPPPPPSSSSLSCIDIAEKDIRSKVSEVGWLLTSDCNQKLNQTLLGYFFFSPLQNTNSHRTCRWLPSFVCAQQSVQNAKWSCAHGQPGLKLSVKLPCSLSQNKSWFSQFSFSHNFSFVCWLTVWSPGWSYTISFTQTITRVLLCVSASLLILLKRFSTFTHYLWFRFNQKL